MPKVFEKDGYLFFFYMNEHLPIHIHVMKSGKKAQELASDRRMEIVAKWHQIFGKEP